MKLNVYIVKQGTPESRLLSGAGFDRATLQVSTLKGRKRSRGGYGQAPIAWRIEGKENVKRFCEAIVSIIGTKLPFQRTNEEQATLDRVIRTLNAFKNREKGEKTEISAVKDRETIIRSYLCRRYPCAYPREISEASEALSRSSLLSIEELNNQAEIILRTKVAVWTEARKTFARTMQNM